MQRAAAELLNTEEDAHTYQEIRGSLWLPLFSFRDHQAFLALTGLAITRVRGKMPIAHNDRKERWLIT